MDCGSLKLHSTGCLTKGTLIERLWYCASLMSCESLKQHSNTTPKGREQVEKKYLWLQFPAQAQMTDTAYRHIAACHGTRVESYSIIEWLGLQRVLKMTQFHPPCYGQGCHPLDQVAQGLIHPAWSWTPPGLGHPEERMYLPLNHQYPKISWIFS